MMLLQTEFNDHIHKILPHQTDLKQIWMRTEGQIIIRFLVMKCPWGWTRYSNPYKYETSHFIHF